jgi:hypothetical protein
MCEKYFRLPLVIELLFFIIVPLVILTLHLVYSVVSKIEAGSNSLKSRISQGAKFLVLCGGVTTSLLLLPRILLFLRIL